jgi:orotate phosphoribosyltransferase
MIKINFPNTKAVVGTATAGIPHAAYVSTILNMPMAYVRSKIKDHGRAKHIEGEIPLSAPIVIVEDLISTGGSSHEVYKILEKEGYNIIGLVSIFSYNTKKANAIFNDAKIKHLSLTSLDDLLDVALDDKIINNNQKIDILKFRDSL